MSGKATDEILAVDPKGKLLYIRLQAHGFTVQFCTFFIVLFFNSHNFTKFTYLITTEAPVIQLDAKLLAGLTAKAGTKIDLPADVFGKPDPRVKWTKADLVLKPDERITIETKPGHSTLSVSKTTRSDTATYIIEAVNTCGRATATVDVNILGRVLL